MICVSCGKELENLGDCVFTTGMGLNPECEECASEDN